MSKLRFSYEFAKLSLQFDATPSDKRAGIQTKIDDLRKKYSNIIALCTVAYSYREQRPLHHQRFAHRPIVISSV